MTIAVIWHEDGHQWCAADTRLVVGEVDDPVSEIGSKIFSIPLATAAIVPGGGTRAPHFSTEYGFVYAGSALPAVLTAAMSSTLLARLGRTGNRISPPQFEQVAELVHRLARRFMTERRHFGGEGKFSAAFFGWCSYAKDYKVAHIDGIEDATGFRVDLSYPEKPKMDGDPWLVFGSGAAAFRTRLDTYKEAEENIAPRVPQRVIEKMVAESAHPAVGGATSVGFAHQHGFELLYTIEPPAPGETMNRRTFNGLDFKDEIGDVFPYMVAMFGVS